MRETTESTRRHIWVKSSKEVRYGGGNGVEKSDAMAIVVTVSLVVQNQAGLPGQGKFCQLGKKGLRRQKIREVL